MCPLSNWNVTPSWKHWVWSHSWQTISVILQEFRKISNAISCLKSKSGREEGARCSRKTPCHSIGMRIAQICYTGYKTGISGWEHERAILKAKFNGLEVGDINHSKEFYFNFRSYVASEKQNCLKTFFTSQMRPTEFLPPLNIQADKGTNCHRTWQFTSVITVIPDSKEVITNDYFG